MILDAAKEAVHGDRNRDYGHPIVNHTCTAKMFGAFYARRHGVAVTFDAIDVCAFNICQKLSRLANSPDHVDSLIDIAGYAENWASVLHVVDAELAAFQKGYEDVAGG